MMTLAQAERLVRKIDELIGQPGLDAQAAKLAQDYSELGRAANRRLEQCVVMIENGQDLQALQLAEAQPPLLDLLTLLDFRQAKEWRTHCQQHDLPWVEPFYDKHLRLLNATYGKGIASDHAFYRNYRREVMKGNEKSALSILRVIVRLNPGDKNWAQELKQLEGKAVQAALEDLRQVLATGDYVTTMAKLAEIEASALPISPSHPVWLQAQVMRCQHLLAQAESLHQTDAWEEAIPVVEEVRLLANQNNVPLSEADTKRWNELEAWTSGRQGVVMQEQDCQHALTALKYQVETSENIQAAASRLTVEQMQNELNLLAKKQQDAERFGPLDDELARRHTRVCAGLRGRIQKRLKRRQFNFAIGVVLVVAILAAAAVTFFVFSRQKDIGAQLNRLVADRHVSAAENLLARIPKLIPPPYQPSAALRQVMAKASQFVAQEENLKQDFDKNLQILEAFAPQNFTNPLKQIKDQRTVCGDALAKLAPEFKADGETKLEEFDKLWQSHLDGLQPGYNADFDGRLAKAENFAREDLNLTNGFQTLRARFPHEQSLLTNLDSLLAGPVPLKPSLTSRYQDLTNQFALWVPATEHLVTARDLEDYLAGLQQLEHCSLLDPAQQNAMDMIHRLKHSPAELMGALLLPDQPQFWETLASSAGAPPTFKPDQPNEAEREAYFKLGSDKNVQEVYAYKLDRRNRSDNVNDSHVVFSQSKLTTNKFGLKTGLVYDPIKYPGDLIIERVDFDDWDYTNVESKGRIKESGLFNNLKLDVLIDTNTGKFTKSILQLMDELARDTSSISIFRAFVTLKLFSIAEVRPAEWGLYWAPGAADRIQNLNALGANDLRSGDWLVPGRYPIYQQRLDDYFNQIRDDSLEKQARFFQMLAHRACTAGFSYAGFADSGGEPLVNEMNSTALECWGWGTRSSSPVLLLRRNNSDEPWQKVEPLLPFTPLLVFGENRRVLLKRVSDVTLYPLKNAKAFLPPLFSGIYE